MSRDKDKTDSTTLKRALIKSKIHKRTAEIVKTISLSLEHQEIGVVRGVTVAAYRVRQKLDGKLFDKREGLASTEDLDRLLSGELELRDLPKHLELPDRGEWKTGLISVRPEFLQWAQQWGPGRDPDRENDEGLYNFDRWERFPLKALEGGTEVHFVEFFSAANQLFDMDGQPLPMGLHFDYIYGNLHNEWFKLRKVVEALLDREDVHLFPHGGERAPWGAREGDYAQQRDPIGHWIGEIPGYNSTPGRDRCLAFRWRPTVEEYRRVFAHAAQHRLEMVAKAREKDPEYEGSEDPSSDDLRRSVFALDVLGIAGAMKKRCLWRKTLVGG